MKKLTLSAIKADVGSIGGHTAPSSKMLKAVEEVLAAAKKEKVLADYRVWYTGDDIALFMTHFKGAGAADVHVIAWDALTAATAVAKDENNYGAGQDLLKDAFTGNVHGMGPGVAEVELGAVRPGEAFMVLTCDKTEPGAFNLPLYLAFADPMNTGGLLLKKEISEGFVFRVMDVNYLKGERTIELKAPDELYELAALLRDNHRFVIHSIYSRAKEGEVAAVASTSRLHNIAGKYTGKDDPVAIVRVQGIFVAPEELTQAFTKVHYVGGNTRGSHHLPLMPVAMNTPATTPFCIPMVSALSFSVNEKGVLSGPIDYFANPVWQFAQGRAYEKAQEMRSQGFSGPAMLNYSELEYGGIREIMEELDKKFKVK